MKRFSIVLLIVLLTSTFVFADELKYNYITPGYYTANKMFAIDENFKTTNKNNEVSTTFDKENFVKFTEKEYSNVFRYPKENVGNLYEIKGDINQVIGNQEDGYNLFIKTKNTACWVVVKFNPGFNFVYWDNVTLYCKTLGIVHYENSSNARNSAVLMELLPNTPIIIK